MAQYSHRDLLSSRRYRSPLLFAFALALAFSLFNTPSTQAQHTGWQTFGLAEGVVDNVTSLAQDNNGRLWVGTIGGLRLYTAGNFQAPARAPDPIQTGWVNILLATPDGTLWVGLDGGLYRLNPDGDWQDLNPGQTLPELNNILALAQTSDGIIWAAGRAGLVRWDGNIWQSINEDPHLGIKAMAEDSQKQLWLAVETQTGNQAWILDRATGQINKLNGSNALPDGISISAILSGNGKEMWVATDSGLFEYEGLSLLHKYTTEAGLGSEVILSLLPHPEGGLWIGTTRGVQHLEAGRIIESLQDVDGLPGSNADALLYDSEGGLWIGMESGVARLPGLAWEKERDVRLGGSSIRTILAGPPGKAYAATANQIFVLDTSRNWQVAFQGANGLSLYTLASDQQGNIWVGTNRGLARLDGQTLQMDDRLSSERSVYAILATQTAGLWVGTDQGVYQFQEDITQLYNLQNGSLGIDIVTSLWQTGSGDIWVGTLNGGASRWSKGKWAIVNRTSTKLGLADNIVITGVEDRAGNVWFATLSGLSRLQAGANPSQTQAWRTFIPPEIGSAQVHAIWEDEQRPGLIWVGTQGGLNLIYGDQTSAFGSQDGLQTIPINSLSQSADGTLWLGSENGLVYHHDAKQAPRLEELGLQVNQKACMEACLESGISYRNNTVQLQYHGLDLAAPDGVQYQVLLERQVQGVWETFERVWTKDTSVTRTLPTGFEYRFSVQAYDRDFNASGLGNSLAFTVKAPSVWDWLVDHPILLFLLAMALMLLSILLWRLWHRLQLFNFPIRMYITAFQTDENLQMQLTLQRGLEKFEQSYKTTFDWPTLLDLESAMREEAGFQDNLSVSPLQKIGTDLHQALWPAEAIELSRKFISVGVGRRPTHLSLNLNQAPRLRALPWEGLYGGQPPAYLAVYGQVAIVRDLSSETESEANSTKNEIPEIEQVKIITAWASPRDLAQLFTQEKNAQYFEALLQDRLRRKRLAEPVVLARARWDQFIEALQAGCTIVQFDGHGQFDKTNNTGVLYFEDENHDAVPIPQSDLVNLMKSLIPEKRPRLVVLNACRTADYNNVAAQTSLAEALVSEGGVAAAVGMGYPISDEAARLFNETFYQILFDHGQSDYAVMEGRKRLANEMGIQYRDWAVPRLYCRVPNGEIFRWK